jgi:hypothetical protein
MAGCPGRGAPPSGGGGGTVHRSPLPPPDVISPCPSGQPLRSRPLFCRVCNSNSFVLAGCSGRGGPPSSVGGGGTVHRSPLTPPDVCPPRPPLRSQTTLMCWDCNSMSIGFASSHQQIIGAQPLQQQQQQQQVNPPHTLVRA